MTEPQPQPRRSPIRVALYTFLAVIALGIVLGVVAFVAIDPGGDAHERGRRFGNGLAKLSLSSALIAYFVQWRRTRHGGQGGRTRT